MSNNNTKLYIKPSSVIIGGLLFIQRYLSSATLLWVIYNLLHFKPGQNRTVYLECYSFSNICQVTLCGEFFVYYHTFYLWIFTFSPSSVPVWNCTGNWTELVLLTEVWFESRRWYRQLVWYEFWKGGYYYISIGIGIGMMILVEPYLPVRQTFTRGSQTRMLQRRYFGKNAS